MIEFRNEKRSHRVRFNRQCMEIHWNDFTQRLDKVLAVTQPVSHVTPDGTEHRFKLA